MFKVLVIADNYPPLGLNGVKRTLKFTKYMKKFNWEPTVITTGNIGFSPLDLGLLKEAENAGIQIIRTEQFNLQEIISKQNIPISIPRKIIRNILLKISKALFIPDNKKNWAKKAYKLAQEILQKEKFDLVYVAVPSYSSFIYAAKLKREFGISLFVDYNELWAGNPFNFFLTPYHKYMNKKMEYTALHTVDKVIVNNRKKKENILLSFPLLKYNEVSIIPNGYDPADFGINEEKVESSSKMKLTYAGILNECFTAEFFLKAFKQLSIERPDIAAGIELEFIGNLSKENKELIKELNITEFVKEHGYLEHNEVLKKIKSSDVLWLMVNDIYNSDTISTEKLSDYFGSKKPILGCLPEGPEKLSLKEYGASFLTKPEDIREIYDAIIKIHGLYVQKQLPEPNKEFLAKYNVVDLTDQLTTEFQFYLRAE